MAKLECIVEFNRAFILNPEQVTSLAEDIKIIQSLPVPTKEISEFGGGQPTMKRVVVESEDCSGRPPLFYHVSYENDIYNRNKIGKGTGQVHFSLHSRGYSSAELQKIKSG